MCFNLSKNIIKIIYIPKKKKQPPLPPKVAVPEDEWKDFQEEEQKDYSNLKLGQLTITEEQQNQVNLGQDADEDGQSDGEGLSDSAERRASGPWKKVVPTADGTTEVPIPAPLPVKTTSSVYVSPALRNQVSNIFFYYYFFVALFCVF